MAQENNSIFTPPYPLSTAVLFLVFNRLDTTKQVFEAIRQSKPPRLYIAADGARETREGEAEKVGAVREFILSNIDWECEIKTLFREENLGCKYAVSGAIDWFFANEEMGIILEDDCLPSQSFFWFCEELLERYKDDMRVWHIGGVSTIPRNMLLNSDSYYFSIFNHIWGWASWASRWNMYDVGIHKFLEFKQKNYIENIVKDRLSQYFWLNNFESVYLQQIDTWDYQWCFTTWLNGGINIIPTTNLVSNIGFGANATHTSDSNSQMSNMLKEEMHLAVIHPTIMMPNTIYDKYNARFLFNLNYLSYYKNRVKRIMKKLLYC